MSIDSTPYITEALAPITDELWERLDGEDLAPSAVLAIQSALCKVASATFREGWVALQHAIEIEAPVVVNVETKDVAVADPWAERYGA